MYYLWWTRPYARPYARAKNLDTYIQAYMPHQETPQTNPMAQWDPLDVSLNPLGPPGPPHIAPLGPQRDLLASLNSKNHLNCCLTYHLRTHQIPLLILWDILTLLLETLRP